MDAQNANNYVHSPVSMRRDIASYVDFDIPMRTLTEAEVANEGLLRLDESPEQLQRVMRSPGERAHIDVGVPSGGGPHLQGTSGGAKDGLTGVLVEVVNPCPNHPDREVAFIDKTERVGLCGECISAQYRLRHEVLSVDDTVAEVKDVLLGLEGNML